MKLFILLGCLFSSLQCQGISWRDEFVKSVQISGQEDKKLILFFTGSDWSGPSMKMKKEILDTPEFIKGVQDHFILVEIDFPQHKEISEARLLQNKKLQEQFHVTSFPCLLLLDPQMREIARIDYCPEKRDSFADYLVRLVQLDKEVELIFSNKCGQISGKELIDFYKMAQELNNEFYCTTLMEEGIKSDENGFFMTEKYHYLVQKGKIEEAKALRAELVAKMNEAICYSVALIDFQHISKSATKEQVEEVVYPLKSYLMQYGKGLSENIWRTEMMIAQVYMTFDYFDRALPHAQRAYEKAPAECKAEIAQSLQYIEHESGALVNCCHD